MDSIPEFKPNNKPDTIGDLVFLHLTQSIETNYQWQVDRLLEMLKVEEIVLPFLKSEKERHKQIVQQSEFLTKLKPLGSKSPEVLKAVVDDLVWGHLNVDPDNVFSYSGKLKNSFAINAPTQGLVLPLRFNFIEGTINSGSEKHYAATLFANLSDYTVRLYLMDFLDNCIKLHERLGALEPLGKDFAVIVYFNRECKQVIVNFNEYQKPINDRLKPTIISIINNLTKNTVVRLNHIISLGLTNGISEAHGELRNVFNGQQGFEDCQNLNELLRERLFFVDNGEIERLDLNSLAYSEKLYEYYNNYFKFEALIINGVLKGFMPERAQNYIDENNYSKYPWPRYCEGFLSEYKKEVLNVHPDELGKYHLRYLECNWNLPDRIENLATNNAYKHGQQMAKIYKAWELVIRDLPTYEKLMFGGDNKTGLPVIKDEFDTDKIYNTFVKNGLLFKCSKIVFDDWFVNGKHSEQIQGRIKNRAQLVHVFQRIMKPWDTKTLDKYFSTIFKDEIKKNKQYKTNEDGKVKTTFNFSSQLSDCKK